jgi:hypothetical protein
VRLDAVPDRDVQLFEVDRLRDEVERTPAKGRDRVVD